MTFKSFNPPAAISGKNKPRNAGISVSMRMVKGHGAPTMNISFLPALNQRIFGGDEPAHFSVSIGEGDDFGKIRLTRCKPSENSISSMALNRRGGTVYHSIKLRAILSFGYQDQSKQVVSWVDLGNGAIEITLPKWAEAYGKIHRHEDNSPVEEVKRQIRLVSSTDIPRKQRDIIQAGLKDKLREERERQEANERRKARGMM